MGKPQTGELVQHDRVEPTELTCRGPSLADPGLLNRSAAWFTMPQLNSSAAGIAAWPLVRLVPCLE